MSWKIIPTYYFDKYGKHFLLFKMNTGVVKNLAEIKLPHFYRSLLETWLNAGGGASDEIKSFTDIRNQIKSYGATSTLNAMENAYYINIGLILI